MEKPFLWFILIIYYQFYLHKISENCGLLEPRFSI